MKLFVLGLDGASYKLIQRFMGENKLPEFHRLEEEGIFQRMGTTIPPHTAPGWMSIFSGTGPGQHGIYQFWDTQAENYCGEFMGSGHLAVPALWEILNIYGLRTALVNIPMTYPPKELNGINITWPLANTLHYAWPRDILKKISSYGGHYTSDINNMFHGDFHYIEQAIEVTKKRVKTVKYLIEQEEWDLCISVFTEIDRVSHFYWQFFDPASPMYDEGAEDCFKNALEEIYMETDKAIGEIRKMLPEDAEFMLVSDHGFTVGRMDFYLQTFLMKNAWLYLKEQKETDAFSDINWFHTKFGGKKYEVDFERTRAYMAAPGSYGVNINVKGRQKNGIVSWSRYEEERDKLIKLLGSVSDSEGEPLFERVVKREEVYHGDRVNRAPDIILIPKDYGIMVHHRICDDVLFGPPEQKGMHDEDAIFGFCGKEHWLGKSDHMAWEDVAPTILDIFRLAAPDFMEGNSRLISGNETCQVKEQDIKSDVERQIYSEEERKEVSEKLKLLGYL